MRLEAHILLVVECAIHGLPFETKRSSDLRKALFTHQSRTSRARRLSHVAIVCFWRMAFVLPPPNPHTHTRTFLRKLASWSVCWMFFVPERTCVSLSSSWLWIVILMFSLFCVLILASSDLWKQNLCKANYQSSKSCLVAFRSVFRTCMIYIVKMWQYLLVFWNTSRADIFGCSELTSTSLYSHAPTFTTYAYFIVRMLRAVSATIKNLFWHALQCEASHPIQ